jgi:hypothetical protein
VFPISERRINQLIKAAAKRAKVNPEASAFQGSGSDPGLTAALGRLKFNVGRRSEA